MRNKVIKRLKSRWGRKDQKGNLLDYIELDRWLINKEQLKDKIIWAVETNQEHNFLDFKKTYTDSQLHKLELVRDIVAMANTSGGFIILGVNEFNNLKNGFKWHPTGLTDVDIQRLTNENIRGLLAVYLQAIPNIIVDYTEETFPLGSYQNVKLGIIYIEPSKDLILISQDGDYEEVIVKNGEQKEKQKQLFKSGDIFLRKGARTERMSTVEDWNKVRSRWRKSELSEWQEEYLGIKRLAEKMENLINILSEIYRGPEKRKIPKLLETKKQEKFSKDVYFLGPENFEEASLRWIQENDDFSIRLFLDESTETFYKIISNTVPKDIEKIKDTKLISLLDNLSIFGIQVIRFERNQYLTLLRETFYKIYQKAERFNFQSIPQDKISRYWTWKELLKRIYTLGAYSLERKHYRATYIFIDQPIEQMKNDYYWRDGLWIRHGLTMLARADQLQEKSLCKIAIDFITNNSYFYTLFEQDLNKITEYCCQFDWLQCLIVIAKTNDVHAPYPSFGIYQNHRTTPIISLIIRDELIRKEFGDISDQKLAKIISRLDQVTDKEFFMFNGWDSTCIPEDIKEFLEHNLAVKNERKNK